MPIAKDYGWTPVKDRSVKLQKHHFKLIEQMPHFFIANQTEASNGQRVVLWDCAKKVLGRHIHTLRQMIGSCVSQGATNAVSYCSLTDIVLKGEFEKFIQTYAPYMYGRCRYHAGIRGRGDGSTGSGAAKAAVVDGALRIDFPGLTGFSISGETLTWDGNVEMQWSDGAKIGQKFIDEGKLHLIKSTALCTSYEQARDALYNGYPVTVASMQGFTRTEVANGKLWGLPRGSWAHQMVFCGVDDDQQRPGLYCQNSWGADAHPRSPDDAPPGGFWVDAEVATKMFRQQDSFIYSQFDGFPETKLKKELFKLG